MPESEAEGINSTKDQAVAAAAETNAQVKAASDDLGEHGEEQGEALGNGLTGGMANMVTDVYNAAFELAEDADDGVEAYDLLGESKTEGKNVGSGLISGMGAMSGGVWTAAYNLAQNVLSGTQSGLDSHSPSKEAAKLGKTAPQGLAVGIEEDTHLAEEAAEEQAQSVINAYSKGMKDLDPYAFGGMKAVLPPETFKGMNAVLEEAGLQANNNKSGNNALFAPERLTGQMENVININVAPAPTPEITLNLNGREFARATAHDTDMVNGTRQILRDRGLSI